MSRPLAPSTSNNAAPLQRIVNWAADRVGISSPAANPPDTAKMPGAEAGSKKSKSKAAATTTPAAAAAAAAPATLAAANPNSQEFVRTRNAFITALTGLTSSLDKFAKAYLEHSDVVIETGGVLDITPALAPLAQLVPGVNLSAPGLAVGPGGGDALAAAIHASDELEVDETGKKRRKRTTKPRDPNAPKRPMTAYFRFMQEQRPLMTEQFKNEPVGEDGVKRDINKLATERWKEMSEQQRESYHAAYRKDRQEYEAAMKALGLPVGKADMHEADADHAEPAAAAATGAAAPPTGGSIAFIDPATYDPAFQEVVEEEVEEEEPAPSTATKGKGKGADSAKKTPRSGKKKGKDAAVPTPQFSSINVAEKPSRKRATAETEADSAPRKRGRKSGTSKDADAAAASAQLEQEQPAEPAPKAGKKDKKSKKRKSEPAE